MRKAITGKADCYQNFDERLDVITKKTTFKVNTLSRIAHHVSMSKKPTPEAATGGVLLKELFLKI